MNDTINPKNIYRYVPGLTPYTEIEKHAERAFAQTGQSQYILWDDGRIEVLRVGDDVVAKYLSEQSNG